MKIEIPEDMDIPKQRRDTTNSANVRWLIRNLFIRNKNHPEFERVIGDLKDKKLFDVIFKDS